MFEEVQTIYFKEPRVFGAGGPFGGCWISVCGTFPAQLWFRDHGLDAAVIRDEKQPIVLERARHGGKGVRRIVKIADS